MSGNVKISSGDLPKYFPWGVPGTLSTTTNQSSLAIFKESPYSTFQAVLSAAIGVAVTGTITIYGSNDYVTGSGVVIGGLTTTSGSATVTSSVNGFSATQTQFPSITNTAITVGMLAVGTGIPAGTVVATVTNAGSIALSANATVTQAGTGSITFYAFNWCATSIGTITLSGTTAQATPTFSDGFTTIAPWRYVKAVASNITGAGATLQCMMGV